MLPTIARDNDAVVMIDQRKLPVQEIYVRCRTAADVAKAIKTMVIRGAPAIGVAAALGIALGMRRSTATGTQKFATEFYKTCDLMAGTRPTAVNLFWAIDRMKRSFAAGVAAGESVDQLKDRMDREAVADGQAVDLQRLRERRARAGGDDVVARHRQAERFEVGAEPGRVLQRFDLGVVAELHVLLSLSGRIRPAGSRG